MRVEQCEARLHTRTYISNVMIQGHVAHDHLVRTIVELRQSSVMQDACGHI